VSKPHDALKSALLSKAGYEIIQENVEPNRLRFFGRVRPSHMPAWLEIMQGMLVASEKAPWTVDISRQYFLRGTKMFWGWRVILQGDDVHSHLNQLSTLVQNTRILTRELNEAPLNAGPNRNALRNGRGAQPMGQAVVGPLARAQLGR